MPLIDHRGATAALAARLLLRVLPLLCAVLGACYDQRLELLEKNVKALLATLNPGVSRDPPAPAPRIASIEHNIEKVERDVESIASGALCGESKIRQFLTDCRSTNGCRADNFEANLAFMIKQPHVMAYLDAQRGVASLTDNRRGQLLKLIASQPLLSTTTLLVVAMPAGGFEQQDVAYQHALRLRAQVLALHPRLNDIKSLPAQAVGCNKTTRPYPALFSRLHPADRREERAEPRADQPQVIAWIFLVNC